MAAQAHPDLYVVEGEGEGGTCVEEQPAAQPAT
eukprot:COSAG05_NODE_17678_length_321_cov_0.693694_1_plen_32_part_10